MVFIFALSGLLVLSSLLYYYSTSPSSSRSSRRVKDSEANGTLNGPGETVAGGGGGAVGQFQLFQRHYLTAYLLAVAGDWLQGPHVYALYDSYRMSKHQIELLFIAGFGSSLAFGTFVGSVADKYGRRTNVLLYALLYGGSCITKHFASFNILLLGRLLGGIATSILFSAFESWLVHEHFARGFDQSQLSQVFSDATLGNSIVAILAGLVAQLAADAFGYVAPFDVALVALSGMALYVLSQWPENYGDQKAPIQQSFIDAVWTIRNDKRVMYLGLIQSLFEASMYTFVLEWTPALSRAYTEGGTIPHGLIFASFMLAVMIGSSVFKILSQAEVRAEQILRFALPLAAACLATPILFPTSIEIIFGAFILFEVSVGLFWPAMGLLRGLYLPEASRSTIMNFFRIPLNMAVVAVLWNDFSMETIFSFCTGALIIAACIQQALCQITASRAYQSVKTVDLDDVAGPIHDEGDGVEVAGRANRG